MIYKVLANAQLMAFLLDLVKFTSTKQDFCCYPITVHRLSYHSLLHYASPKCTTFGWQAPNTLSYTTTFKIQICLCTTFYRKNVPVRSHTFYILTPSYTSLEVILSIPALHPGLRWHPSRGHNLGGGNQLRIYHWLEYVSGIWVQDGISGLDSVMPRVFTIFTWYILHTYIIAFIYVRTYNTNLKVNNRSH